MEAGRLNAYKAAPDAMRAVQRVEAYIQQCGLEKRLIELVKMRASQINGCAYCLHVHSKDARHGGETEQRLYLLRRLARIIPLHRARAGCPGVDRSFDAYRGNACAQTQIDLVSPGRLRTALHGSFLGVFLPHTCRSRSPSGTAAVGGRP